MNSYALKHCLERHHLEIYAAAASLVASVTMDECRCHELARAVLEELTATSKCGDVEGLTVVDGRVGGVEHSWLVFTKSLVVLDVYRPGFYPQVVLVARLITGDYVPGPARRDLKESAIAYLRWQMAQWR